MSPQAWPTTSIESYLSGDGVKRLNRDIWDSLENIFSSGITLFLPTFSTSSSTYTNGSGVTIRLPAFYSDTETIGFRFNITVTGGTSGEYIIRETTTSTDSTSGTLAAGNSGVRSVLMTIPDGTWGASEKTFAFRLKQTGGGTIDANVDWCMMNMRLSV